MTATSESNPWARHGSAHGRPLMQALAACAGLAAAMGVGRFAYTPLMPVMIDAQRLDAHTGAVVAAANYAGYLLGAVLLARVPKLHGPTFFRLSALALIASEAVMAVPTPSAVAAGSRLVAGVASAVIFVGCARAVAVSGGRHGAGIAFAGVGVGIAITGVLVLVARPVVSWQGMWAGAAALTALLLAPAVRLPIPAGGAQRRTVRRAGRGAWRLLLGAYFLEGLGYIVIGTFLVAAVSGPDGAALAPLSWVIVGVAAAPATVVWGALARRWQASALLPIALFAQLLSAVLLAVSSGTWQVVLAAALFGATFMGITLLAMEVGGELRGAAAAASLTAVYGAGQLLGPLLVAPLLGAGYGAAFAVAAVVLAAGTLLAVVVARTVEPMDGARTSRTRDETVPVG
ncbi:YbfB/YjiJ family MFS transporter [Nocardia cyriacigeorgica]|uniref:YbfB/YjiJ family MFS transporter n=1 Tax=Nocardia cyriacigeorgica TaxID=135487 RepID=UPI0024561E43|nr:YbfB/YjiJ family MFS transporter [Nocardia cyriacigeorgica]